MLNDSTELSTRERQVLDLLRLGLTNRQIAERLCVSANTVNKHVQQVLRRLGVGNRVLAVMQAHSTRVHVSDDQNLHAIESFRKLNQVEQLRAARIEYAEALDRQGRSGDAKEQWRLTALADRDTHDPMAESLDGVAG